MSFITGSLAFFPPAAVRGKEGGDPVIKNMFEMIRKMVSWRCHTIQNSFWKTHQYFTGYYLGKKCVL